MARLSDAETAQAADALSQWFMSQDISLADAGLVMLHLTARLLIEKDRDIDRLKGAIALYRDLLTVEIVEALRA